MTLCANPRCDGYGWCVVTAGTVDRTHPIPAAVLERIPPSIADEVSRLDDFDRARRAAAMVTPPELAAELIAHVAVRWSTAETVYPCRVCNPDAFLRWCGGHWDRYHNRRACDECSPRRRPSRTPGQHDEPHQVPTPAAPPMPPPRLDLD